MKQSSAYGHIQILSPDGRLMFLTNENRLNFYRKNDLVERIDSKQYRLKFEPKGLGHYDRNTQLLAPRDNRCVRCGNENIDVLTKHHIVPSRFLRHLPEYLKGNNHKYIVLVCRECHDEYCFHENEMDDVLAKKYGVKTIKECNNDIYVNHRKMMSVINAIDKEGLPQSRREKLKEEFHVRTGLDYSEENVR